MQLWLLVGIGGFFGAILRFFLSGFIQNGISTFPIGTMGVNIIGSFAIGFLMYLSEYQGFFDEEARIFLMVGLLGAFTTMSTFSYESLGLLERNEIFLFNVNVIGTVVLNLFAVYLGRIAVLNILGS